MIPGKLFKQWRGAPVVLAAVSGGPDSMALLALLAQWRDAGGTPEIFAATVDHGLRPEAAGEAQLVEKFAGSRSIPHAILRWQHDSVRTRVQEQARAARYDRLLKHAADVGATVLMTGHHADDQAETILFRLLRGSGLAGLAGMAAESRRGDHILARPLLGLRKKELVEYCSKENIPFCQDPSNADPSFARARMRSLLPLLEKEGFDAAGWARFARRMARAEAALSRQTRDVAAVLVRQENGGLSLKFRSLAEAGDEIGLRLLNLCIGRLTGGKPRLERAEALLERLLAAERAGEAAKASLGGVQFTLNKEGLLRMERENRRRANLSHK